MPQRILEPGQIETLAQRSIPRVRLPSRDPVFARRAARLRALAQDHPLGDYLRLMAFVADAQQQALAQTVVERPHTDQLARAREHAMPPLPAAEAARGPHWHAPLRAIAAAIAGRTDVPPAARELAARLRTSPTAWLETQVTALLAADEAAIDFAVAPFLMAALQVPGVALASTLSAAEVTPLDVARVCPLCGSAPVASIVAAQAPYAGYRYLHCALCATEWHCVRVQCTQCGGAGKDIAYRSLAPLDAPDDGDRRAAVRAETCDACRAYRKIFYLEHDAAIEPVADDLASLSLDLLLAESGYHRASGNPLLWQPAGD